MSSIILFIIVAFLAGIYFCANYTSKEAMTCINGDCNKRCPDTLIQKGCKYHLFNSKLAPVPGVNPIVFNNLEEYTEFTEWQRGQGIRCPVLYLQETYDTQGNSVYKTRPGVNDLQGGLPPTISNPSVLANGTNVASNASTANNFIGQNKSSSTSSISSSTSSSSGTTLSPVVPNGNIIQNTTSTLPSGNGKDSTSPTSSTNTAGYVFSTPTELNPYSPTFRTSSQGQPPYLFPERTMLVDSTRSDGDYNKNSYPARDESAYYVGTSSPLDDMDSAQKLGDISPNPMDENWGGAKYTQQLVDQGYYAGNEVSIAVG
jgi:hypothetical protein